MPGTESNDLQEIANRFAARIRGIASDSHLSPPEIVYALSAIETALYSSALDADLKILKDANASELVKQLVRLYDELLKKAEAGAIQYARGRQSAEISGTLRQYFRDKHFSYHEIAAMGDNGSLQVLLQLAKENLAKEYFDAKPMIFYALTAFSRNDRSSSTIESFFRDGLRELTSPGEPGKKYNFILIPILCSCLHTCNIIRYQQLIYDTFAFVAQKKHCYQMNQSAGDIAIILSNTGYSGSLSAFDNFLETFQSNYNGNDFVMKVNYAYWMITGNKEAPLAYLCDSNITKGKQFAAAALADLHVTIALPHLRHLLKEEKDLIRQEVFIESIHRLTTQKGQPDVDQRIIHLFGIKSKTELALGDSSDNVFVDRAIEKSRNPETGGVYETHED